jgi:hypothetical protein
VLDAGTAGGRLEVTPLPSRPPRRTNAYMRFTKRSKGTNAYMRFTKRSKGARGAQVALDEAVDDAALAARFSKRRHTLTVMLPIR